ncbi:galactokinase [Phytoactinopolyspora halotolerans]|uniref:Galactokinase n=1 Tax=Phytoactinopolyspora halotolerans TaxID=1981512 RepID=A0A6L9S3E6_9ACTN|nr:galactokinase [Phytoactinopolyspora halotolerans]NED99568.1 galactokinase [Phytoactinopolyspora halotolerans]
MTITEITGSAPGRVNLIGEHTDYNGGFALPLALPHRTTATLRRRSDRTVTALSSSREVEPVEFTVETKPGDVAGWAAYVAGVFWALREAGHELPGVDVQIDSDVPSGAGLSSSAALECSVLTALDALAGLGLDPTTTAVLAQQAENHYVGAPTGLMDQMASMHGRAGHVVLFDAAAITAEPIPCDLAAAGLSLLIVDTRVHHRHADGEYGERRRTCEDAAQLLGVESLRDVQDEPVEQVLARLDASAGAGAGTGGTGDDVMRRRVRHVLSENERVMQTVQLLRSGRLREIGPLLTASHASLRDDYEVTVRELDVAVDAAVRAGALGARMTGGGFGGSIIALVDDGRAAAVADAVRDAFTGHGFTAPDTFVAVPSAGASVASSSRVP